MKVFKVSTASGQALDRLVAKVVGWEIHQGCTAPPYSKDWALAGPIIEREEITIMNRRVTNPALPAWFAVTPAAIELAIVEDDDRDAAIGMEGDSALVAALRCLVASKLGETVDMP